MPKPRKQLVSLEPLTTTTASRVAFDVRSCVVQIQKAVLSNTSRLD